MYQRTHYIITLEIILFYLEDVVPASIVSILQVCHIAIFTLSRPHLALVQTIYNFKILASKLKYNKKIPLDCLDNILNFKFYKREIHSNF